MPRFTPGFPLSFPLSPVNLVASYMFKFIVIPHCVSTVTSFCQHTVSVSRTGVEDQPFHSIFLFFFYASLHTPSLVTSHHFQGHHFAFLLIPHSIARASQIALCVFNWTFYPPPCIDFHSHLFTAPFTHCLLFFPFPNGDHLIFSTDLILMRVRQRCTFASHHSLFTIVSAHPQWGGP